jgi:membrane protease YdiL (CAAX protease family)
MAAEFTDQPPPPSPPTGVMKPPPRGHPLIAWAVIAVAAATLFVLHLLFRPPAAKNELDTFELQARSLVGAANLGPTTPTLYQQAQDLNRGAAAQRLRFVVLAGELKDPEEAVKTADMLKDQMGRGEVPDASDKDADTADILARLYRDFQNGEPSAPRVTEDERGELRRRLGWFGDLALHPRNEPDRAARAAVVAPAQRSIIAEMSVLLVGLGAGAVGFVLLILFLALWRQMRSRFKVGAPYGGIYAEAFALWMLLFVGLSLGSAFLPAAWPHELLSGGAALASLSALAWPVFRGVPWRLVRQDIGWHWGDRPALEPFCGILCYLAALPVVIFLLVTLVVVMQLGERWGLRELFGPEGTPTHPIVDKVLHSGWQGWVQAVFLASVVAPLMEETMFRGVLYRHMREATAGLSRWLSVILSALVVSFVFAALHPQGLLAIPLLMTLAFGFTAAREWRGSLVPSMTVHALHNGVLMLILILAAA